jgi:hypothetical protein
MKRRLTVAGLAAVVALLSAVPVAGASSSPSASELFAGPSRLNDELKLLGQGSGLPGFLRNRPLAELRFENRDGYRFAVVAFGQTVALSVTHDHGHRKHRSRVSTTTYFAHGKVTPTSIQASFGERGRIEVQFQPSGRVVHATRKAGCKRSHDGTLADLGIFAGELRFQGEGGYTSAEVHRVPGRSVDFAALIACLLGAGSGRHAQLPPPRSPLDIDIPGLAANLRGTSQGAPGVRTHPKTGPKSTALLADSKVALSRTVFAAQAKDRRPVHFFAIAEASEGSIGILRFIFARGAPAAFAFDNTLSGATVTPPLPFRGSGKLEHGPGGKSWTGSLAVSFLGAPHVPLTGSPFEAWLARGF